MLRIRKEQNDALAEYMLSEFVKRVMVHLRAEYPQETQPMNDEELRDFVEDGIQKAEGYNIELEDDVQEFIEFMVVYGPKFDNDPKFRWAKQILDNNDLDGSEKMDEIGQKEAFLLMEKDNR